MRQQQHWGFYCLKIGKNRKIEIGGTLHENDEKTFKKIKKKKKRKKKCNLH